MSMATITHVVVHYSATYGDEAVTAADIDRIHKQFGWKGIGYHWFIRRDGTVEQGRPESHVGAHDGGKIGICWAGGLDRATGPDKGMKNITQAQEAALIAKIKDVLKRHPGATVVGHRDLAATQCPAFDVLAWWAKAQKKRPPAEQPVPAGAPAKTPDVDEDAFHVVEKGETWWSIAREHGVDLDDLLALNEADEGEALRVGRKLRLRASEPASGGSGILTAIAALFAAIFSRKGGGRG